MCTYTDIPLNDITRMNGLCQTYTGAPSHKKNESCRTHGMRTYIDITLNDITRMNGSCQTYTGAPSHKGNESCRTHLSIEGYV